MTMTYEAWRVSFQDAEQAARAAFRLAQEQAAAREASDAHMNRLALLLQEHHQDFMSDGSKAWDEEDWNGRVAFALEDTPSISQGDLE